MKRRVVSIFSGIDCISLGMYQDFDVVLGVEINKKACKTLLANKEKFHPNMKVLNKDICVVSDEEIKAYEGVDGVIGGPPCQPFSAAKGAFNEDDERKNLIFEYLRWVKLIKPKFFLFENVEGLVQKTKVHLFNKFIDNANKLGYKTFSKVLDSHDYGSAQKRRRVIVVGFREELNINFEFPLPVKNKKFVRDILDKDNSSPCASVRTRIAEIMPYIPEGKCWRSLKDEELIKKALQTNYERRNGGMTGTCRRLHRDKPCPTLVTSPSQNTTLLYHPVENRVLSITEYKKAQGIPSDYEIIGTLADQYKFIGNGVPVEMSYEISKAITKALDNHKNLK